MVKLTNKAEGPRSVHTKAGFVTIPKGGSVDVEIGEADLKAIKAAGVLDEAESDPSAPRAIPGYPNLSLPEARAAEQALDEEVAEAAPAKGKAKADEEK